MVVEPQVGKDLRADAGFVLRGACLPSRPRRIVLARAQAGLMQVHQHARAFLGDRLQARPAASAGNRIAWIRTHRPSEQRACMRTSTFCLTRDLAAHQRQMCSRR